MLIIDVLNRSWVDHTLCHASEYSQEWFLKEKVKVPIPQLKSKFESRGETLGYLNS